MESLLMTQKLFHSWINNRVTLTGLESEAPKPEIKRDQRDGGDNITVLPL